jgi:hypothetical protein
LAKIGDLRGMAAIITALDEEDEDGSVRVQFARALRV